MLLTAPSLRTTISLSAVRRILLRVAAVAAGCDQASSRSAPSLPQLLPLPLTQRRWFPCHDCRDLAFNTLRRQKRFVPAALQLAGHEAIGWIDGIVLLTCMAGLVTRLLQRQLELPCAADISPACAMSALTAASRPSGRKMRRTLR
jgi:hypothetical protein